MALITPIAGAYTSTLNAQALGPQQEGYELQGEPKTEQLERSDLLGDMLYDIIYKGYNWAIQFEALQYTAAAIATALNPWAALGVVGTIGQLGSNAGYNFVLTSTTGTPAALSPATLTASRALLAPNWTPRLLFAPKLRTVPMRLQFLPYDAGAGVAKHFVTT